MISTVYFSPPQLAKLWAVSPEKVRRWIEAGELAGANVGDRDRPRYRIAEADAAAFWSSRQTRKAAAITRRRTLGQRPVTEYV